MSARSIPAPSAPRFRFRLPRRDTRTALLYIAPAFIVMGIITFYPLLFQTWMSFTDFQLIYAITRGGPNNATHLMATLAFQRAIAGGNLGEGAAIAVAMNEVKGKNALALSRDLGISYKSAFVLMHKIREAMASGSAPSRP